MRLRVDALKPIEVGPSLIIESDELSMKDSSLGKGRESNAAAISGYFRVFELFTREYSSGFLRRTTSRDGRRT